MIGMKKGGKRLFILPPDIGYSGHDSSPTFPTDTPIMVLLHVKRVKFSRGSPPDGTSREKQETSKNSVEKKSSLESSVSDSNDAPFGGDPMDLGSGR